MEIFLTIYMCQGTKKVGNHCCSLFVGQSWCYYDSHYQRCLRHSTRACNSSSLVTCITRSHVSQVFPEITELSGALIHPRADIHFIDLLLISISLSSSPLSVAGVTNNSASNFIAGAHLIPIHFRSERGKASVGH